MALIQVDDTNFQKISNFGAVPADQIKDTDLITGLHDGGNANFRIYDIVSKVMEGIDIDPGQDPGYDPGGELGEQVTYSVIIDHSKSDPAKMCTYADDAIAFNGRNGWNNVKDKPIFKKIKPCVLNNGSVLYYLNPDNYAQKDDGTAADITTLGNDVMVEFGERMGYRLTWINDDMLKVSVTNRPNAAGFYYDAFSYNSYNDSDKIYIGAYKGYIYNNRSYSSHNRDVAARASLYSENLTQCRGRGSGYECRTFGSVVLYQALGVIVLASLDTQSSIATGWMPGSASYHYTGVSNAYGFCNELFTGDTQSGRYPVKFLGLEDAWGHVSEWVYGVKRNGNNIDVYDYLSGQFVGDEHPNVSGYMSKPIGGRFGFLPKESNGSESTKYCDRSSVGDGLAASYGGWGGAQKKSAGLFAEILTPTGNSDYAQTRLMYFHRG